MTSTRGVLFQVELPMFKSLTHNRLRPIRLARSMAHRVEALYRFVFFDVEGRTSLATLLERKAGELEEQTFLRFEGRRWSFRQVEQESGRRAYVLARDGVRRGQVVALMMTNRPDFLFDVLALSKLGAVPALINTHLRGSSLRHALSTVRPKVALVGGECLNTYQAAISQSDAPESSPALWVDFEERAKSHELPQGARNLGEMVESLSVPPVLPAVSLTGRELAAYIYTSGTTGLPKAGRISNNRLLLAALAFGLGGLGLGPWDTLYCCLPLYHGNGFLVAFGAALCCGATFALSRRFSASRFWSEIRATNATAFVYIGEICRYLLDQPPDERDGDHRLRGMIGNGLQPDVWRAFVDRFRPGSVHEFYAATEGNVNMVNIIGRFASVGRFLPLESHNNALLVRFDPITQSPLRNAKGRCIPCKRGQVGELLGRIDPDRVATRFEGYADRDESESKIIRDVLKPGDTYYRTGDLLRKDWLGFYFFVDRIGDTFRWKGENVSTSEVAQVLANHASVNSACAYGVSIRGREGRAAMAAVVLQPGKLFDGGELYAHLAAALPAYARPAFIRVTPELNMTSTFKVRLAEYAGEGFDPRFIEDPLYYRDEDRQTYRPLDPVSYERVLAGDIRF